MQQAAITTETTKELDKNMAKPFYVEYKNEIWDANFCPCPPSVSAEIIVMIVRGEITRTAAKKLFKIMVENWTKVIIEKLHQL